MCILPCSIDAYLQNTTTPTQDLVWFLRVRSLSRAAWRAARVRPKSPHVYQILEAMLFASQTFKALLRKALYVVVMWAMVFSSVQSQTITPVTQTDFAIKIQDHFKD